MNPVKNMSISYEQKQQIFTTCLTLYNSHTFATLTINCQQCIQCITECQGYRSVDFTKNLDSLKTAYRFLQCFHLGKKIHHNRKFRNIDVSVCIEKICVNLRLAITLKLKLQHLPPPPKKKHKQKYSSKEIKTCKMRANS